MTSTAGTRYGSWGRVLRVDLSARTTSVEEWPEERFRRVPGGRALIAHYLLTEIPAGADPLGPDNVLVFAPGVVTGIPMPGASRHSVGALSPISGGFGEAEAGGFWGAELKRAGWDAIVIRGVAGAPVYLAIRDDAVEIRDAAHVWGLEVAETEAALRDETGDRLARVSEIGPAGENLVRFAAIVNDLKDVAARAGIGAVMGSKRLKAIVVRGTRSVPVADAGKIKEIARWVADTVDEEHWGFHNYGTGMGLDGYTSIGGMNHRNFDGGVFADAAALSAETLADSGMRIKMEACWACSVRCKKVIRLESPYRVDPKYGGPEFESLASLGSACGVGDAAAVCKANERCNALGMDTLSAGATLAWAMDAQRSGTLEDAEVDGHPLRFGDPDAMLAGLEAIAHRRGLGDLLAEGSARAAASVGGTELLTTVKGLELAMHDPRQRTDHGGRLRVSYSTSPTGGDHLDTHLPSRSVKNSVGMCFFLKYDDARMVEIVNAVTGWGIDLAELATTGERSVTLARLVNLSRGLDSGADVLPDKLMRPQVAGPLSRVRLDPAAVRAQIAAYYGARGWDEQGVPRAETVAALGLDGYLEPVR